MQTVKLIKWHYTYDMNEESTSAFNLLLILPSEIFLTICTTSIVYIPASTRNNHYEKKYYRINRNEGFDTIETSIFQQYTSYLTIKEWMLIDSAFTNRILRKQYLAILDGCQIFSPIPFLSGSSLAWIARRKLKLLDLCLSSSLLRELKLLAAGISPSFGSSTSYSLADSLGNLDLSRLALIILPNQSKETIYDILSIIKKSSLSIELMNFDKNHNMNISLLKKVTRYTPFLSFLSVSCCSHINDLSAKHLVQYGQRIRELNLSKCYLSDEGLKILSKIGSLPCLQSINLSYCHISYSTLSIFLSKRISSLYEIWIDYLEYRYHNTKLLEEASKEFYRCLKRIASVEQGIQTWNAKKNKLQLLSIRGNEFLQDDDLVNVLPCFPLLKQLNLTLSYRITDESLIFLSFHLPALTALDVRDCFKLTDRGVLPVLQNNVNIEDFAIDGCYLITSAVLIESTKRKTTRNGRFIFTFTQCPKVLLTAVEER
jgi:hypothetical protein